MGAPATCAQLNDFSISLEEKGLILEHTTHYCQPVGKGISGVRCQYHNDPVMNGNKRNDKVAVSEYLIALEKHDYSLLMNDGGIVKISINYRGNTVQEYRYSYLPCPITLIDFDKEIDPYVDIWRHLKTSISEMDRDNFQKNLVMVAPLRFEWKRDLGSVDEPESHVHLGVSDGRVAVSPPISIWNFLHFTFKNFYPTEFKKFRDRPEFSREKISGISVKGSPCIGDQDMKHIHILVPSP